MPIECVATVGAQLGEGALWDASRGVLWWVDIRGASLHSHEPRTGRNLAQALDCRLTALGLTHNHELIACGDRGFVRLGITEDLRVNIAEVIQMPHEPPGNRFNDGKVDAAGRFWAGTMDDAESATSGTLYCLDARGSLTSMRSGMRVPNGPCFLTDGTVLVTDSPLRRITALHLNREGAPATEREFAQFSADQGFPDGMTVDAQDHVWVAFWDGWCLRRLSPSGQIVAEIPVPVQRPTCPAFGGERLQHLYLTTARTGLNAEQLAEQPWAGDLLRLDVGVLGRQPARFAG